MTGRQARKPGIRSRGHSAQREFLSDSSVEGMERIRCLEAQQGEAGAMPLVNKSKWRARNFPDVHILYKRKAIIPPDLDGHSQDMCIINVLELVREKVVNRVVCPNSPFPIYISGSADRRYVNNER